MTVEVTRYPVRCVRVKSWVISEDYLITERIREIRIRKGVEPGVRIRMMAFLGLKRIFDAIIDGLYVSGDLIRFSVVGRSTYCTSWEEVDSIEIYEEVVERDLD